MQRGRVGCRVTGDFKLANLDVSQSKYPILVPCDQQMIVMAPPLADQAGSAGPG